MSTRGQNQALPTLTGLRAVAAGLVFLRHVGGLLPAGVAQDRWLRVFGVGLDGVSFFFLLSGFVLAWSYRSDDTPGSFYRRRAARIGPNHLVTWLVALPLIAVLDRASLSIGSIASTLSLTQAWIPTTNYYYGVNGVEWSLSCEVLFYLTLPLLIGPLYRRRRLRYASGGVAVAVVFLLPLVASPYVPAVLGGSAPGWREWLLYNLPLTRFAEFLFGVVLGIAFRLGWRPEISWGVGVACAVVGVVGSALLYSPFSVTAATLLPFAAVIVAAAAADLRGEPTAPASRYWVRLGEWSFAFYLVHQLVVRTIAHEFSASVTERLLIWAPAALITSVLLSAALFSAVERPLERRLRSRPAQHPPRVLVTAVPS